MYQHCSGSRSQREWVAVCVFWSAGGVDPKVVNSLGGVLEV